MLLREAATAALAAAVLEEGSMKLSGVASWPAAEEKVGCHRTFSKWLCLYLVMLWGQPEFLEQIRAWDGRASCVCQAHWGSEGALASNQTAVA